MTCARYRALISRYLDDELTPRQRTELLDHIKHCPGCSAALARYRSNELLIRKLSDQAQPAPAVKRRVLDAARKSRYSPRRGVVWLLRLRGRISPRVLAPALLVGLLAVVAGLVVLNSGRQGIGRRIGFSSAATATVPSLELPASPTAALSGAAPPRLLSTSPFDGAAAIDPHSGLLMSFDQPMDRRSVEHALRLSPPVNGSFTWDADNQVRFIPATGLLRGVTYRVALTDGARSLVRVPLPPTTIWGFSTLPAPAVSTAYPPPAAIGVAASVTLVLTFSRAMDEPSLAPLRLSGDGWELGGAAAWSGDGKVMRVTPSAPLPPGRVNVFLAGGKDRTGGSLPPTGWDFNVDAPANGVSFIGPRLISLALGGNPEVGYTAGSDPSDLNARSVGFSLYSIDEAALEAEIGFLADPYASDLAAPWPKPSVGNRTPVRNWNVPIRGDKMELLGRLGRAQSDGPLTTSIPVHEPGLYLLTAVLSGSRGDARLVALGDDSLMLLVSGGRLRAWVSKLGSGRAVSGATVRIYGDGGTALASGTTDAQGIFSAGLTPGKLPAIAISEKDGDFAAIYADEPTRHAATTASDNLTATVILDRSVYRAGDLVQFTCVVASQSAGEAGGPVSVGLREPAGREIGALTLQPDSNRAVHGSFILPGGAAPGNYCLLFGIGGRYRHASFEVVERDADMGAGNLQIAIAPAEAQLYAGTEVTATIRADYGPPAVAPSVPITLSLSEDDPGGGEVVTVVTGTTGLDGLARIPLRLPRPRWAGGTGDGRTYVLLASGEDGQGRRAKSASVWTVRAGSAALEQSLAAHAFVPGAKAVLTLRVHNEAGRPLAGQLVVSGLAGPLPPSDGLTDSGLLLSQVTSVTNAEGVATATLMLSLQGAFSVVSRITDSAGSRVEAATRIWVFKEDSGAPWAIYSGVQAGLSITPDAADYAPGETARILVQSGDPGGGLLIARLGGRVVSVQEADFAAGGGLVDLPIPADVGVERSLSAEFVRFAAGSEGPRPVRATVSLALRHAGLLIGVHLPNKQPGGYSPGDSLPLRLTVREKDGSPASGEVLLRLSGVGPDAPTAYWNSAGLDLSGQLSTTLGLPADAGDWNLDIWAFTPAGAKQSRQLLHTRLPVGLRAALPAWLVQGDTTIASALVTNNEPETANASIRLSADGEHPPELTSPGEQAFRLAPGESRRVAWTLRAPLPGNGRLALDLAWGAGGRQGTIHRAQSVTTAFYGITDEQTHAGAISDDETINMTLPPDVDPATADLEVRCAPTLAGVLDDAMGALTPAVGANPGPVSDVASRLGGKAVAGATLRRLGLGGDPPDTSPPSPPELAYLYVAQSANGGWGDWPGSAPDLATTTAVLSALWALSRDSDAQVDASTVNRGLAWLRRHAEKPEAPSPVGIMPNASDSESTPAALYALSLYGVSDPASIDRLLAREPRLGARGRAMLALTLAATGRGDEARLVVERLAEGANESADPVVLEALVGADTSAHGPVVGVLDRLLAARPGSTWGQPAETWAAIRAISRYMSVVPESRPAGSYRVLVNGTLIREVQGLPAANGWGSTVLDLPGSRLHTGENSVRLEAGGGHLYYSLRVRAQVAADQRPIASRRGEGAPLGLLRVYQPGPGNTTTVVLTLTVVSPVGGLRLDDALPAGLVRLPGLTFARLVGPAPVQETDIQILDDRSDQPGLHAELARLSSGTYVLTYQAAKVAPGSFTALPGLVQSLDDPAVWVRSGSDNLSFEGD